MSGRKADSVDVECDISFPPVAVSFASSCHDVHKV